MGWYVFFCLRFFPNALAVAKDLDGGLGAELCLALLAFTVREHSQASVVGMKFRV